MDDVYSDSGNNHKEHSLRYLQVKVHNVLGIVNRMTSLLRRKRYFIEDISVTFDDEGYSYIVLVIDSDTTNVSQVMQQLRKLHDVIDVTDISQDEDKLYEAVYVYVDTLKELNNLPLQAMRTLEENNAIVGVYLLKLSESHSFIEMLKQRKHRYIKRLIAMV